MRVLIVSDIHANLAALDAVLRDAGAAGGIDAVWCLGDAVGYGPQPAECIALLREMSALWVAGNHERAATGAISTEDFNPDAALAANWTASRLDNGMCNMLDALPEVAKQGDFTLVHGTLREPIWEYLYSEEAAEAHLALQETPFGLVGHTHVPAVAYQDAGEAQDFHLYSLRAGETIHLSKAGKAVLNPGSVGQPRDKDPRASYAIYNTDEATFTVNRVEYDIKATQKLMSEAALPRWLIERLSQGR